VSRQFLIPGSPFGGYINETTASQYLIPNVVYLSDTSTAAAAALEGTATGITTVTGALVTQILLVGSSTSLSTASGALTTQIQLVGSVLCVCTAGSGITNGAVLTVGSTGNTDTQSPFPPPPPITHMGMNDPAWRDWLYKVNNRIQKDGQIAWTQLSFLGSSLANIADRKHNDLQDIQGGAAGDHYHITKSTYSDLNEVVTTTANYSVTLDDGTILCDASGGLFTITVLAAIPANRGKALNIKKIDSTKNAVHITCVSLIDGVTTWTIIDSRTNMQLKSDGSTWRII